VNFVKEFNLALIAISATRVFARWPHALLK